MREIEPELKARLESGVTTLCRCWRVTRADGLVQGFTDHDEAVVFEGVAHEPSSGFDASSLESGLGLSVDNSAVVGALSSPGLSAEAIAAGRYDAACVDLFVVDWQRPDLGFQIFTGSLGEIRSGAVGFEAELRSLSQKMNLTIGRTYLPTCDRELGDAKCGADVSAAPISFELAVEAVAENRVLTLAQLPEQPDGWFDEGRVHWLTGNNVGLMARVKRDVVETSTRRVELWQTPSAEVRVGDTLRLVAGCNKRAETCRAKFANIANFRGFPHMPREDFVTAYPSGGGNHDGGSRTVG